MSLIKKLICNDLSRYLLIVLAGVTIDLIIFLGLIEFGAGYYLSFAVGFGCGTVVNVLLLRQFHNKAKFKLLKDVMLTFAANGSSFWVGLGVFAVFVEYISGHPLIAKIASIIFTFFVNYLVRVKFFQKNN